MSVMRWMIVNTALLSLVGFILPACGSDEPAATESDPKCGTCQEPDATVDLTMPVVSFQTDVFPIVRQGCNSITCHGVGPAQATEVYPGAKLYLGPPSDNTTTPLDAALFTSIVTGLKANSRTSPAMKIVAPGDPANSFLVHKIHGCQNEHGTACDVQSEGLVRCKTSACGDVMPPLDQLVQLTADQKNTFRRWIAQGALDN